MTSAIDTHIHLDRLDGLESRLEEARQSGIHRWVVPGVTPSEWSAQVTIADQQEGVYLAPGIHPQATRTFALEDMALLRDLMRHPKVVAIGEVGLDRQVGVDSVTQECVFVEMIRLAKEFDKPLLIHSRKATEQTLALLRREGARDVGGLFHAFSGSLQTAEKIVDLGFGLGIGGVVTWPTAKKLPEVVRKICAEALVVETDAPYLSPAPHQGQENRPVFLTEVIAKVAELKGWPVDQAVKVTTENAARILKRPELNQ